jgi:WD40 repeat protein
MHGPNLKAFDFSPDGPTLATASDDNVVPLWDWQSGRQIGEPMTGHQNNLEWVEFSNDGHRLYSRSWDSIRVWDTGDALE